MNPKETKEFIAKTLQDNQDEQDSPILTPEDKDFDLYWDMVKDFDASLKEENSEKENIQDLETENKKSYEYYWNMVKDFDYYITKNETLNEEILNEVAKNECGFELQSASIALIPNLDKYNLPEYSSTFSLSEKIQWLITYLNTVAKNDLIGLKLTNVGTINYKLNSKFYSNRFIIHVGNCHANSIQLTDNNEQPCGLHHMKYGKNMHWNESCDALLNVPNEFKNPVKVIQCTDPNKKYNYTFYSPNGYTYAFGVPKDKYSETILISCY